MGLIIWLWILVAPIVAIGMTYRAGVRSGSPGAGSRCRDGNPGRPASSSWPRQN